MGKSSEREEFWRLVLDEYRSSGLTIRAFCKREALPEASFYAWRKRLGNRGQARDSGLANQPGGRLIPVDIIDSSTRPVSPALRAGEDCSEQVTTVEVLTPCGFTVRVNQTIEASRLSKFLEVIVGLASEAAQC